MNLITVMSFICSLIWFIRVNKNMSAIGLLLCFISFCVLWSSVLLFITNYLESIPNDQLITYSFASALKPYIIDNINTTMLPNVVAAIVLMLYKWVREKIVSYSY